MQKYTYTTFGNGKSAPRTIVLEPVERMGYQYKYQGQERQDELGLNWDSFKWRNYDYAIGRFMSVDPLTEKYNFQSPYNFSKNRVMNGRELEGLEWKSSTDGNTVQMNLTVRVVNSTDNQMTTEQVQTLANDRASLLVNSLNGTDLTGRNIVTTVTFSNEATISWDYTTLLDPTNVESLQGKSQQQVDAVIGLAPAVTDKIGDTQTNRTQINIANPDNMMVGSNGKADMGNEQQRVAIAQTGVHEDIHVLGGRHSDDVKNPPTMRNAQRTDSHQNAMNGKEHAGTHVLKTQRTEFVNRVKSQQQQH